MSQENVELVRDSLNTWIEVDEGLVDPQRLVKFYAPDSTLEMGTYPGWPGHGGCGWRSFMEFRTTWMEPYDDWHYEPERILDAGENGVVVLFHQRGKLRDGGSWVEQHYAIVYTVEEGLITHGRIYASAEEALEAAGLSD